MAKIRKAKVYLIGAGPGDPLLISQKALLILQQADVVLYDSLCNENLLFHCPPHCKKISVGKKRGSHSTTQQEIHTFILNHSKKGQTIIRLKGGTPSIFGRLGEELLFLYENNIDYEIIPGISSGTSAAELFGIPITHRDTAHSVAFLTGSLKTGQSITTQQIPKADTLIIFMGIQHFKELIQKIINSNYFSHNTPISVISHASTAAQKIHLSTLETILIEQKNLPLDHPSIIIIGKSIHNAKKWINQHSLPLQGKRIHLLRRYEQSKELYEQLTLAGAEIILNPSITLQKKLKNLKKITPTYLNKITLIIFTSPNAVRFFFNALQNNGYDARVLAHIKIVSIGNATTSELKKHSISPDAEASTPTSEGLVTLLKNTIKNEYILLPTAEKTRNILKEKLSNICLKFTQISLYKTSEIPINTQKIHSNDWIFFTSSQIVKNTAKRIQKGRQINALCLGPITEKTAKQYFKKSVLLQKTSNHENLVSTIIKTIRSE
ncbi:MAG: uroporphyrinogen-III C-methyltransferase [bacterium]